MNYNRICSCGKMVAKGQKCSCRKVKTASQKEHVSRNTKFQKLRKIIIQRDEYHCQRCMALYGLLVMEHIQVHHIKSWRDFPELAYEEDNLITVCQQCNLDLGNSNKLDFEWKLPEKISYFL